MSIAGVHRRAYRRAARSAIYAGAAGAVGYGLGAYYGGYGYPAYVGYGLGAYYGGYGYPAYSYSAQSAPYYGTDYSYGSYYGGYGYPGYSTAPYNPRPYFGFGWRY